MNPENKYGSFPVVHLNCRQWPDRTIMRPPIWCSVDLRDGNQALPVPMTVSQKTELFRVLVDCGFKEIEVGFPSAAPTEYEFLRRLIDDDLIPVDVTIQVLVQAREDLIKKTVESLSGVHKAIIHMYNSTSPAQRRVVFGLDKPQIMAMAVQGTKWVNKYTELLKGSEISYQYSPESFSATELDFSLAVCEAVMDVWQPTINRKIILNLPATVEVATPNIYADQIEWFCRNVSRRDSTIISVHTHNDRGTGVAATELGIMAGADRVEGTLFGNGERTGNLDIVNLALNLFSQGIDPKLDFSDIDAVREVYERCTGMKVPPRQPYSGELVFTAFSGSHQDAIKKGLAEREKKEVARWDVPYLAIDPSDIGRKYKAKVIRVNGQSGKAGISYLLEHECGICMPKKMQIEFGAIAGPKIDALGREVTSSDLKAMFYKEYILLEYPYKLLYFKSTDDDGGRKYQSEILINDKRLKLEGIGNGPIHAFLSSLKDVGVYAHVLDQSEHTLGGDEKASAIAYVQLKLSSGENRWGAGVDTNIELASIKAIVSALNRG